MKILVRQMPHNIDTKNSGIGIAVRSPNNKILHGHLNMTKTTLEWCESNISKGKGIKVKWEDFIDWMKKQN